MTMTTKIKICGITNLEDAEFSLKCGADSLGFNFYGKSPRYIAPGAVRQIIDRLPAGFEAVGVFVNEPPERVCEIAVRSGIGAIQLHGEETPGDADAIRTWSGLKIIKAFRVSAGFRAEQVLEYDVDAVLLDAYRAGEHGGTGETFDWQVANEVKNLKPELYLAGGLSPENVAEAVRTVRPYAVDACSCLEKGKGVKDQQRVREFIIKCREADKV